MTALLLIEEKISDPVPKAAGAAPVRIQIDRQRRGHKHPSSAPNDLTLACLDETGSSIRPHVVTKASFGSRPP